MGALEASKSIKIWSKMEPRRFLTPSGRTWRAREAKMGALEGLGGQILDTFVKSEGWGGGPGAEGIGVRCG